eukprot:GHRQ01003113.1.p1 GENE.GHRQ01003113.1~~GHRQ01003113.1.p1  ORF type:complete len:316 (+),score=107.49 GHRQ01003113.1:187-1134(+)
MALLLRASPLHGPVSCALPLRQQRCRLTVVHSIKTTAQQQQQCLETDSVVCHLATAHHIHISASTVRRSPELSVSGGVSITDKVEPMLALLVHLGLQNDEIELVLLRCPKLFSYNVQSRSTPVVEFLSSLGYSQEQLRQVILRFPHVLGYDAKGHLIPHCHYLKSLGLTDGELSRLILLRPHVLGSGIEPVITYLRKWLRIERTHIGRLLWSYPLDYSLPRLVLPSQVPALAPTVDESADEAEDSSSGGTAAGAAAAGLPDEQDQQQDEQQVVQPPALPPIGSAERCTWLVMPPDSDDEEGDASSGNSSNTSSSS